MVRIRERLQDWREARRARHITYEGARLRAGRGAAFLDGIDPVWFWRVDAEVLEMGDGCACVLGQLHGAFLTGLSRAHLLNFTSAPRPGRSPVELGFLSVPRVCEALQEQDYEYLNQAWREEIRSRREAASRRAVRRSREAEPYDGLPEAGPEVLLP